jgi:hypothetical protein
MAISRYSRRARRRSVRQRTGGSASRAGGSVSRAAAALMAAAALLASPRIARSETCPCPTVSLEEAVRQASAIFVGTVLATTSRPGQPPVAGANGSWTSRPGEVDVQDATIQVREMFKGRVPPTAVVSSPSACGYPLTVGETYLVVAVRTAGALWTDACKPNASGGAVPFRAAQVRGVLHPPASR